MTSSGASDEAGIHRRSVTDVCTVAWPSPADARVLQLRVADERRVTELLISAEWDSREESSMPRRLPDDTHLTGGSAET